MATTGLIIGGLIGLGILATILSLIIRAKTVSFGELSKKNQQLEDDLKSSESKVKNHENRIELLLQNLEDQKNANERQLKQNENLQEKVTEAIAIKSRIEAEKIGLEDRLKTQLQQISEINERHRKEIIELNEARKQESAELHKISQTQFQNIANQILEEKSGKFTEINKTNIEALLKPLDENLKNFKKQVEETYDKESKERFSLKEEIKNLQQQSNKISDDANNLTRALKGQSKQQGNWGEMVLETILQNSGLVSGVQYFREENFKDEDGNNLRPDFVVQLPDERVVIIDSKTSLVAYEKFYSADSESERQFHIKSHLDSIYKHIDSLSDKKYDSLTSSLDFIMMFIPIEPAYLAAIQHDSGLWSYAYQKRILLTSPTNLIACLKLISELWRREDQNKNRDEIIRQAGGIHDKFASLLESLEKMRVRIAGINDSYDDVIKQLRDGKGNLISRVDNIKKLGVKTTKSLTKNKKISEKLLPSDLLGEGIDDLENDESNEQISENETN